MNNATDATGMNDTNDESALWKTEHRPTLWKPNPTYPNRKPNVSNYPNENHGWIQTVKTLLTFSPNRSIDPKQKRIRTLENPNLKTTLT